MLLACGGAAAALLARDPRLRYGAAAVALLTAPALVAGDVWQTERFVDLRDDPAKLVAVIVVSVAAVGAAAAVFYRLPWAFPVSAFAALPLRVPVQLGGETSHLLLPLYLVIAAGFACFAYRAFAREGDGATDSRPPVEADAAGGEPPAAHLALPRPGRHPRRLRDPDRVLGPRLERDRERRLLPGPVRGHVRAPHRGPLDPPALGRGARRRGRPGPAAGRRGVLGVRGAGPAAQQGEPASVEPAPPLLPGQLGLLRPQRLRPLPGARAWSPWAPIWPGPAARAAPSPPRWSPAVLLAALALSYSITSFGALVAGLLVVVALRWSVRWALAGGAAILVCGAIFLLVSGTGEQRSRLGEGLRHDHQRPGGPGQGRPRAGPGPADLGLGLGFLRGGVLPPHRARPHHGLALGADHRCRRAGGDRAGGLRGPGGLGAGRSAERGRRLRGDGRGRAPASWRCSSTASAMRALRSTPPPGRCSAWVSRCGARGRSRRPSRPRSATAAPCLPATGDPPRSSSGHH